MMIIDKLVEEIKEKSFVCAGLDPRLERIPEYLKGPSIGQTILNFNKEIIDGTNDLVGAYKVQIAFYEAHGMEGMKAYGETVQYAREKGSIVIGDIKRGDISSTAEAYAKAHFSGDFEVDFITLNPYMGYDSLEAYLPYIEDKEKGIFVLVRTSNPGAKDIEYQYLSNGKVLYEEIGDSLEKVANFYLGDSGSSSIGFVMGATQSGHIENIRNKYSQIPFLIPGYGAQGASSHDVRAYLGDKNNSLVNSSRGIIYAFENKEARPGQGAREAVLKMIEDISP